MGTFQLDLNRMSDTARAMSDLENICRQFPSFVKTLKAVGCHIKPQGLRTVKHPGLSKVNEHPNPPKFIGLVPLVVSVHGKEWLIQEIGDKFGIFYVPADGLTKKTYAERYTPRSIRRQNSYVPITAGQ